MFSVFLSSVLTFLSVLLEVQWVGYTIKLDKPHLARPFPFHPLTAPGDSIDWCIH